MKTLKYLLTLAVLFVSMTMSAYKQTNITINVNGTNRSVVVYTPDNMSANLPLMIVTHGMNQNPTYQSDGDLFREIIDKEKFVVAYLASNGDTWDIGGSGDTNFVLKTIDEMATRYNINKNRVYWSGFSMGTMLMYHSLGAVQGKIAAFAPTSGMAFTEQPWNALNQQINLLHCHSLSDNVFPVKNYDFISYVTNIAEKNGYTKYQKLENYSNSGYVGTKEVWTDERTGHVVALFYYNSGGHWPTKENRKEIWDFCKQFSLDNGGGNTPTFGTDAQNVGNAAFDASNGHYMFYTTTYSSFIFSQYKGTELAKCADFTLDLGKESTTGYRLDVQLKDKSGNVIKDGNNDFIIGTESAGTRLTSPTDKVFNMQEIFADYIAKYPGCTIGDIRLNTAISSNDDNKEGKFFITIDEMKMNVSQVTARASLLNNLAEVPMMRYGEDYLFNDDCESGEKFGGWGNGTITYKAKAGKDDSYGYEIEVKTKGNSWDGQFNIQKNDYFTEGTEYYLSIDVKGSVAGKIYAGFQKSDGYQGRGEFPQIEVDTDWKTFIISTKVTGEKCDRLLLSYGDYVGKLNFDNIRVFTLGTKGTEIEGTNISLNATKENGGEVFGAGLAGHVLYNEYADISQYKKMVVKGTGGELRILFNRFPNGDYTQLTPSLANGSAEIDLSKYPYFHLNSIKAQWGNTVNVREIILTGDNGTDEVADYYIAGAGSHAQSATNAFSDEHATIIDITGYEGKFADEFVSSNPNCLLVYASAKENLLGGGGAFDARNTVKKGDYDYSAWRIDLVDNYNFRSAFEINTVGGASYTRELNTEWATVALPFDLNVEAENSPEIYLLTSVGDDKMVFTRKKSGTIAAGTVVLYHNAEMGATTLSGKTIRPTANGFNIQPVAGVSGWYTAQSLTHRVIEDVNTDPVLKDYEVYGIANDELVHATKKVTLKPFRAFYLCKKSSASARTRYAIGVEGSAEDSMESQTEATAIVTNSTNRNATEAQRYNASGQRITSPRPGMNIIRMSDGTVKKEIR